MPRTKPSLTARKVAADFLFVVEDPEVAKLAPAGSVAATYELLEAARVLKPWMVSLIKAPWYQRFGRAVERPILPGQMLHLVLRKRFIDDEVRDAIAGGISQVLVVGGGFDSLCLRLAAEYPEVTFVELDHPPTHRLKALAVREMAGERTNLHLQGVDLSEHSLAAFLEEFPAWSIGSRSAVVAEGVLMYLRPEEVVSFLSAVRSSMPSGSRLLATYVFEGALSAKSLGWLGSTLTVFLRLAGEPFRWGVSQEGIEPFLGSQGYRLLGPEGRFDLKLRYLVPAGQGHRDLARLERVAAAEIADSTSG